MTEDQKVLKSMLTLANERQIMLAEIPYQSIQGEGQTVGKPMIFVRLQGCNVGCSWCDSYYTWRPFNQDKVPEQVWDSVKHLYVNYPQLNDYIKEAGKSKHIWITGGEPMLQAKTLGQYLTNYKIKGREYHICTSGQITDGIVATEIDHITVDVKAPSSGVKCKLDNMEWWHIFKNKLEFKMVVCNTELDKDFAIKFAEDYDDVPLTLQPDYLSETELKPVYRVDALKAWKLPEFAEWINSRFAELPNVRMGLQLHKHLYPNRQRGI